MLQAYTVMSICEHFLVAVLVGGSPPPPAQPVPCVTDLGIGCGLCRRYAGEVHVTLIATGFPDNFEENLFSMTTGKGARQAGSQQQQEALQ